MHFDNRRVPIIWFGHFHTSPYFKSGRLIFIRPRRRTAPHTVSSSKHNDLTTIYFVPVTTIATAEESVPALGDVGGAVLIGSGELVAHEARPRVGGGDLFGSRQRPTVAK